MKFLKHNIIAIALFSCTVGVAQQLPQFTQYMYNTISINPAYAGSREVLSVVGLHRSQWVGFQGGPITQTLSVHTPLRNDRIGVGLSFIEDDLGPQNFTYLYGDVSYSIPTGRNRIYASLSAPRILNNDSNTNRDFEALDNISYYFTAGGVIDLTKAVKFKPAVLIKATNGAPVSYDLTGNFLFNEKIWLGGSYRINEQTAAIGGIVDFQVSTGTHEILLMYEFRFLSSKLKSPRYF